MDVEKKTAGSPEAASANLRGSPLLLARVAWVLVALLALAITAASAPILFEQYGTLCTRAAESCLERSQLTPEGLRAPEEAGVSLELYAALGAGVGAFSKLIWVTGWRCWWRLPWLRSGRRLFSPTGSRHSSRPTPPGGSQPAGCRSWERCS